MNENPIHVGQPVNAGNFTLTPQIITLEGEANVIVASEDGEQLLVPSKFLEALSHRAGYMRTAISNETDMLRRNHNGDILSFGLKMIRMGNSNSNYMLDIPDTRPEDGTPILMWNRDRNDEHENTGWKLYLNGTKDAYIGFARWDDKTALENLISQMRDPEGMFTISGIMFPETTGRLSSRMAAARMRSARELPGIDLKKARTILEGAGAVTPQGTSRWYSGRIRLLKISSGGKDVPVAVAVLGPSPRVEDLNLTDAETGLSYYEKQRVINEKMAAIRKPWQDKAAAAFQAAGWRLLDLPNPHGLNYSGATAVTWATRIDVDTWSTIQAAATLAASELEMSRGGII